MVIVLYLASTAIGSNLMLASLAHGLTSIQSREDARGAEAVVILSGGVSTLRGGGVILTELSTPSALRVLEGARVFKLIDAKLAIVSGGIADPRVELKPEAQHMADALIQAGVPAEKIALDLLAKNTFDHARTVRPILEAHHIRQFVIVTSPEHMRRALAVFRSAGFDPLYSISLQRSDHLKPPPWLVPNDDSLILSNSCVYEYFGWAYYFARGWL
jgi:uncharacterized SAM-binding protein YcdF (DUF218 family)